MKLGIIAVVLALGTGARAVFFDLEPNNNFAQAQVLARGPGSYSDIGFMSLGQPGDIDILQITLYAGEDFTAITTPTQDTQNLVPDTRMVLLDSIGTPIAEDDDNGPGYGSLVATHIWLTGTYYIAIAGYDDPFFEGISNEQGTYTLSVQTVPEVPAWLLLGVGLGFYRSQRSFRSNKS